MEDFLQYCVRHLKIDIANIPIENVIDEHKNDKCGKGSQHYFADLPHAEGNLIYNIKHRTFCIKALFHFDHSETKGEEKSYFYGDVLKKRI